MATDNAKLWECPDCGFAFDAVHTHKDGGYSCPCCAEMRLSTALASAEALNERLRDAVEAALASLRRAADAAAIRGDEMAALALRNDCRALLASIDKGDDHD